jgi:hypothetical protein
MLPEEKKFLNTNTNNSESKLIELNECQIESKFIKSLYFTDNF